MPRSVMAYLRALLDGDEATLTELRERERARGPVGRTVRAGEAVRPESVVSVCACGAKYSPRLGGTSCLTCERGADPSLAKLVMRRPVSPASEPQPQAAETWPRKLKAVRP